MVVLLESSFPKEAGIDAFAEKASQVPAPDPTGCDLRPSLSKLPFSRICDIGRIKRAEFHLVLAYKTVQKGSESKKIRTRPANRAKPKEGA